MLIMILTNFVTVICGIWSFFIVRNVCYQFRREYRRWTIRRRRRRQDIPYDELNDENNVIERPVEQEMLGAHNVETPLTKLNEIEDLVIELNTKIVEFKHIRERGVI